MSKSWKSAIAGLMVVATVTLMEGVLVVAPVQAASATVQSAKVPDLTTSLPVTTPLSKRPPVGKKVVFMDGGLPPCQILSQGLASAAKALGWSYSSMSYDDANPATLVSGLQSAISDGANVVVVQATPIAEYEQVLPAARAKGVLVIDQASSNTAVPGIAALIDNNNANAQRYGAALAAETISSAHGSVVHAAIVTAPLFATILQGTVTAYQDSLMKDCTKCAVATIQIPASDVLTGGDAKDIVSFLQTHTDTNYVMFGSSLLDVGTRAALDSAGYSSVKIVGNDALNSDVSELRSGQATAWIDEPLGVDGWMSLDAAARAMTGGNAAVYDNRPEPDLMLTSKSHFSGSVLPEFPTNYQQQFEKMWHVKG
jgi:ribose transport system substrate-binding protein